MQVVDADQSAKMQMRPGVTGEWLAGEDQRAITISVLRNWVEPFIEIPLHFHEHEEIVIIEDGDIWVNIDGVRHRSGAGRTVIIPPRIRHAWGTLDGKAQILFIWPVLDPFSADKSTYLKGNPPTLG